MSGANDGIFSMFPVEIRRDIMSHSSRTGRGGTGEGAARETRTKVMGKRKGKENGSRRSGNMIHCRALGLLTDSD